MIITNFILNKDNILEKIKEISLNAYNHKIIINQNILYKRKLKLSDLNLKNIFYEKYIIHKIKQRINYFENITLKSYYNTKTINILKIIKIEYLDKFIYYISIKYRKIKKQQIFKIYNKYLNDYNYKIKNELFLILSIIISNKYKIIWKYNSYAKYNKILKYSGLIKKYKCQLKMALNSYNYLIKNNKKIKNVIFIVINKIQIIRSNIKELEIKNQNQKNKNNQKKLEYNNLKIIYRINNSIISLENSNLRNYIIKEYLNFYSFKYQDL